MTSAEHRQEIEFWKGLIEQNQSLKLPTDHSRKQNVRDISYLTTEEFHIPTLVQDKFIKEIASLLNGDQDQTLSTVVLTLFSVLLTRYTNEETFVVGVKDQKGQQSLACIQIQHPPQESSFSTLLKRNASALEDAQRNIKNDLNLQTVLDILIPRSSATQNSEYDRRSELTTLIQASFSYSNSEISVTEGQTPFSLSHVDVHVHYNTANASIALAYRRDLFSIERIRDTAHQIVLLAEQVSSDLNASIFEHTLVTQVAQQVLPNPDQDLNTNWEGSVHDHFERQALNNPNGICVTDSRECLTFSQLNAVANKLSRRLIQKGLKRQQVVAIFGHRSTAMVWAILSVLKCAASFTIIDPVYPAQRIIDCISVAEPSAVIFIDAIGSMPLEVEQYIESDDSNVMFIENIKTPLTALNNNTYDHSPDNLEGISQVTAEDVAVITFTSGSTGMPKGVMGRHGPLTHYYPFIRDRFEMTKDDRFSMQSGISHDPLQRDIFTPWFLGAEILIPDNEDIVNPGRLAQWFHEKRITITHLTPAMGQLLTSAASTPENADLKLTHLRWAFFVGDVLTKKFVRRMCNISPQVKVINLYGSTETQRSVTYFLVPDPSTPSFESLKDILPIGTGMRDVQSIIYTRHGKRQLCGISEVGEIYMKSPHLSKGYKNKPEENAEKFLPIKNERMYRTGDLGRYLPSGDAECSGRADDQVKIRGFRIELGEINTALNSHEWIKESVTIVRQDSGQDKRIASYFVWDATQLNKLNIDPKVNPGILIRDLRKYIRTKLPDYMVPSHFIVLDKLPLTPNGKIKHADLPAPINVLDLNQKAKNTLQDEDQHTSPRNDLERKLSEIWKQVLGVANISVRDGFFDLGGHSINATLLVLKIRQEIQGAKDLPVELLFKSPTIAALAVAIDLMRTGASSNQSKSVIDLSQEAMLDASIRPQQQDQIVLLKQPRHVVTWFKYQSRWSSPSSILLTGCTGFLGAFILTDLLKQTNSKIYCLVRSKSTKEANHRIRESLQQHHLLWITQELENGAQVKNVVNKDNIDQVMSDRIIPIMGDLSQPSLGLKEETFNQLSDDIDVIIHNGAVVHWMYPYERLKSANVNGTVEIIRMACSGKKLTPIHYVSTTSVFDSQGYKTMSDVYEDSDLPFHEDLSGGYPRSKWVAEKLIMNARRRGLPACIYRPGYVTGHSLTGVWNPDDFLCRMIKGCIQLKMYPDLPHSKLDMSPVDFVSGAIVHLCLERDSLDKHKAYHLVNPNEFYFNALFRTGEQLGYEITKVPFETWKSALYAQVQNANPDQEENALLPMLAHFTDDFEKSMGATVRPWYDNTHTLEALYESGIECPQVETLLGTYYKFLCKCGFLSPPEKMTDLAKELQLNLIHKTSDMFTAVSDVAVKVPKSYQGLMRNNRVASNSDLSSNIGL
ncbi:L-2-aminoadipate reductase LYS2 [Acrasis kona]|uniref:L-2-aminoadipate reductase LYS2 n=1 Tax=Acrasis kona TaxID=1008807 RepID=A0AAW2ZK90_9EUKA